MKLKFGDHVLVNGQLAIVYSPYDDGDAHVMYSSSHSGLAKACDIERLPRVMEMIEVSDCEDFNYSIKITRRNFLQYDHNTGATFPVAVLGEDGDIYNYKYFRLIKDVDEKKEKILELVKAIENNDSQVLSEMAEIIIASREKGEC